MKLKWLVINIVGLFAAVAVLGGSFIYAASNIDQVKAVPSMPVSVTYDDNFYQDDDAGIGDLIFNSSNESTEISSEVVSSEIVSSQVISSAPSSKPKPSSTLSSKPKQSSTPSSKPAPSSVPSSKPASSIPSSEVVLSEPVSSEPSSEEVSSEPSQEENVPPDNVDDELLNILAGAVQREIVGTNTAPSAKYYEAYKAQAVACHSYMQYHKNRTGSYPTMSYSTPNAKTVELVQSVMNDLMYYNGSVINASYHAASGGYTQNSSYVWTGSAPYLQAVPSAYDDYDSTCVISSYELESLLANAGITVSGDPSTWFDLSTATYSDGGFVDVITVGNGTIKGRTLRENVIGASRLKSCKILDISTSGDNIVFTTKGYGHGAGLSQLGALGYASNEGWDYQQILTHYYTGVEVR